MVIGINPASLALHQNFANRLRLNFPLVVDKGFHIAKSFKVKRILGFIPNRTVIIVNKDGIIRYSRAGMPSTEELVKALQEINAEEK